MRKTSLSFGSLLLLSLSLGSGGCGHGHLVPAPSATMVPGAPGAAFQIVDGVRCSADAAAWEGRPGEVPSFVLPVKVRIVNASGTPIRLLDQDFALVGSSGRKYQPIPVLSSDPDPAASSVYPIYASSKFYVSARYHDVYQSLEAWPEPLGRNDSFYERQYRRWGGDRPQREVVRMALPEGVLADGGTISGFLYFESPLGHESRVTFEADFENSAGADTVAAMKIPFRTE